MKLVSFLIGPLISLAIFALAIAGGEWWLRSTFRDISIGDASAPGMQEFYKKYYHGNKEGWRDKDYEVTKPAGTTRVLVLGDSFTFGGGIKDPEHTWPRLMEKTLRQEFPAHTIEVINAARRGATTTEVAEMLEKKGLAYQPDVIVYAINMNDIETNADKQQLSANSQIFKNPTWQRAVQKYYLAYALQQLLRGVTKQATNDEYLRNLYSSTEHQQNQLAAFQHIQELSGDRPIIIGILPNAPQDGHVTLQPQRDQLNQALNSLNLKSIDLVTNLPAQNPPDYRVSFFDYHPKESIHRFFADRFAQATIPVLENIYAPHP
jgi:lysophospholipase L1-like esterase